MPIAVDTRLSAARVTAPAPIPQPGQRADSRDITIAASMKSTTNDTITRNQGRMTDHARLLMRATTASNLLTTEITHMPRSTGTVIATRAPWYPPIESPLLLNTNWDMPQPMATTMHTTPVGNAILFTPIHRQFTMTLTLALVTHHPHN
ncbi:uncharacterized protein N7459_000429 [Penicillium hispanicum]|uniref:uncharacterized protein n=1 Tax=Penicillium hispanicum TaxID=1080232 RepID=UPI0025418902|nr:uncharacterized protein N7459_000429 [Penicillium hispanicum]KAJ5594221.1 hypothetical protein N7459_000429 [Penicillium hispanicum]